MASSDTEIANLSLTHLGITNEIADLETESSQEARSMRRVFQTALKKVLRDFNWPLTTVFAELSLVEENPDFEEWLYSYRYPTDCLFLRRVLSGERTDTNDTRAPFKISQDVNGLLIYTDVEDAQVEYTKRETDYTRYPSDFVLAFSYFLAHLAAPSLTGGDPFKLGDRAYKFYGLEIESAKANALNEEQPDVMPESEFIQVRET